MSEDMPASSGCPWSEREAELLAITLELLREHGYDRLSVEAVATKAKASKATMYRRWPSKTHLVFDAVFGAAEAGEVLTSTGDFEADLRAFVAGVFEFWRAPDVAAAALGILADRHRDPELFIRTQQLLDETTRTAFGELVRAGIDQGVLDADIDIEIAYDALVGTSFYIAQVLATETVDAASERLCSLLLGGMRKKENRDE